MSALTSKVLLKYNYLCCLIIGNKPIILKWKPGNIISPTHFTKVLFLPSCKIIFILFIMYDPFIHFPTLVPGRVTKLTGPGKGPNISLMRATL